MQHEVVRFDAEPTTAMFPEPSPLQYPPPGFGPPDTNPLVIDFGSYETRAGWAGNDSPSVEFRSLTGISQQSSQTFKVLNLFALQERHVRKMAIW